MTLLLVAQTIACLAGMVAIVVRFTALMERAGRAADRRYAELLNHIQYGERLPTDLETWPVRPEREPDQIGLVGRIDDSEPES